MKQIKTKIEHLAEKLTAELTVNELTELFITIKKLQK